MEYDMTEVMGEPCWFHQVMTVVMRENRIVPSNIGIIRLSDHVDD